MGKRRQRWARNVKDEVTWVSRFFVGWLVGVYEVQEEEKEREIK